VASAVSTELLGLCAECHCAHGGSSHIAGKFSRRLQLATGLHRRLAGASPPVTGPSSIYAPRVVSRQEGPVPEFTAWSSSAQNHACVLIGCVRSSSESVRRKRIVEQSIRPSEVESATWSARGTLDWWVKERQQAIARCPWGSGSPSQCGRCGSHRLLPSVLSGGPLPLSTLSPFAPGAPASPGAPRGPTTDTPTGHVPLAFGP
jgi:hypothetical protein